MILLRRQLGLGTPCTGSALDPLTCLILLGRWPMRPLTFGFLGRCQMLRPSPGGDWKCSRVSLSCCHLFPRVKASSSELLRTRAVWWWYHRCETAHTPGFAGRLGQRPRTSSLSVEVLRRILPTWIPSWLLMSGSDHLRSMPCSLQFRIFPFLRTLPWHCQTDFQIMPIVALSP